jgi:hypothetical protein
MSAQERRVDELADVIDVWWETTGKAGDLRVLTYDAVDYLASIPLARALIAAGYEKRPDHVAEADEIRKQVRG